jgi:predicted protein tyrosine phosphatase
VSSLRTIDLVALEGLVDFVRGRGFVLDFSDSSFALFFATELEVDINDPSYADLGGSKGKRLKRFLQKADDRTALKTVTAQWEYRTAFILRAGQDDPVKNASAQYRALLDRLGGNVGKAQGPQEAPKPAFDPSRIAGLRDELFALSNISPQARGFAFEAFLKSLFDAYGLKARDPFRNRGEQTDGSFVLANETYLLEAKWQNLQVAAADLHAFNGKVEEKAAWARGLFISHSGFSEDGLQAFGRGKRIVCMDGFDIYDMFERGLPLNDILDRKIRRAAETGRAIMRVRDLF